MFNIGVSTVQELDNHYVAVAVLWDSRRTPTFTVRGITLEDARRHFPCIIIIQNSNLINTINTACNRAIEQLIIQELLPAGTKPDVKLLMTTNTYSKNIMLKTEKHKSHWLITVSRRLLTAWLEGER